MKTEHIIELGYQLLKLHNLDYTIVFDTKYTEDYFGYKYDKQINIAVCQTRIKTITFNPIVTRYTDNFLKKIILHEIAHALVPNEGHTPKFRSICKSIGGITSARIKEEFID